MADAASDSSDEQKTKVSTPEKSGNAIDVATQRLGELRNGLDTKKDTLLTEKNETIRAVADIKLQLLDAKVALVTATEEQKKKLELELAELAKTVSSLPKELGEVATNLIQTIQSDYKKPVEEDGSIFSSIGKKAAGLFKNIKMPAFMKSFGIGGVADLGDTIGRLVKRGYFSFMATIDKFVPDFMRGAVESQIDGSKEMLMEMAAEDGVRDAVKIIKKGRTNFNIPWDNVVWQNWRNAYDVDKKNNPNLSARTFVSRHILNFIRTSEKKNPDSAKLVTLEMKNIEAPIVAPAFVPPATSAPAAVPPAPPTPIPTTTPPPYTPPSYSPNAA